MTTHLSIYTLTRPTDRRTPDDAGDWREQAACAGLAPMFDDTQYAAEAAAICARCPVRMMCLEAAMDEERGLPKEHRATIRGGLDVNKRVSIDRAERRRQQKISRGETPTPEPEPTPPPAPKPPRATRPRPDDCDDPGHGAAARHQRAREPFCSACRAFRSAAEHARRRNRRAAVA